MEGQITLEQVINFLLETPMFEELNAHELSEVVHIMQVQRFREGQAIFREGDHGDAWYVLFKGTASVTKNTPFGPPRTVATLEPHACFGEMAILDGSERSAAVRAVEEVTLFRFPRLPFTQLLEEDNVGAFKLVHGMARVLCQRQRRLTLQLSDLMEEIEEDPPGPSPRSGHPARSLHCLRVALLPNLLTVLLTLALSDTQAETPAEAPYCEQLTLRATSAAREGYACESLAEGLAVCYLCEDRPISTTQLQQRGYDLARLSAEARAQTAAAVDAGRPLQQEIHDMPGRHYWVSAVGDGLDAAALLHPERLAQVVGAPPVVAVPGVGALLAWAPGDEEVDTVIAVGVRRMSEAARRPVSARLYHHKDGEWKVWGEARQADPDLQR